VVPGIKIPGIKRRLGLEDDNEVSAIIPPDPLVHRDDDVFRLGVRLFVWLVTEPYGFRYGPGFALPMFVPP
jgi:hypothetical protein